MSKSLDLKDFERALDDYAAKTVPTIVKDVQSFIAKEIYVQILSNNPVLTGLSRANWFVTIDQPSNEVTSRTSSAASTGAPPDQQELAQLSELGKLQAMPLGRVVYITNNLDYIELLEDGSSRKAPSGIAAVAISSALEVVQSNGVTL